MAQDKKSFVLYADLIHTVKQLTDKDAGVLFKHILMYVNDDKPTPKNIITKIAFEPVKQQLKRDLIKYEKKREQWSKAGKASADKRKQKSTDVDKRSKRSTDSTVNVNVNVNDNVNVINSNKKPIFLNWLNYKKEIKKEVKSKSSYNTLVKRFNNESLPKCEWVVNQSIENNWQGLFWDKYVAQKSKKPTDNLTF